jgi:hypothetical protein
MSLNRPCLLRTAYSFLPPRLRCVVRLLATVLSAIAYLFASTWYGLPKFLLQRQAIVMMIGSDNGKAHW